MEKKAASRRESEEEEKGSEAMDGGCAVQWKEWREAGLQLYAPLAGGGVWVGIQVPPATK
jgi:hypothetical protein